MLSQLEFRVVESADEQLEKAVHDWLKEAVFFIGASWYSNRKETKTVCEVSEDLRLRWILSKGAARAVIEQRNGKVYWLGGYWIGNTDPFMLDCFNRHNKIARSDTELIEAIVKSYLPLIEVVQCYYCGDRFGNEKIEGNWCCCDCAKDFTRDNANKAGFVYIFGSKVDGYFKIGCGDIPNNRMSDYKRSKLPFPVEMIYVIPADDKRRAEAELHRLYREQHTNGEWYKLSPDDLTRLENVKKYVAGQWVRG